MRGLVHQATYPVIFRILSSTRGTPLHTGQGYGRLPGGGDGYADFRSTFRKAEGEEWIVPVG